jgi:hypothetical protein
MEWDFKRPRRMNLFLIDFVGATIHVGSARRDSMITNYTDHAANERTFLAWIRTGMTVAAFGFSLFKLNALVDAAGAPNGELPVGVAGRLRHAAPENKICLFTCRSLS